MQRKMPSSSPPCHPSADPFRRRTSSAAHASLATHLAAWQQIKEELEELDDIRAYDQAKAQPSEPVPFEQAMRDIQERKPD